VKKRLFYSPENTRLFVVVRQDIQVWDTTTRVQLGRRPGAWIGYSRDGRLFLTLHQDTPRAWDADTGAPLDLAAVDPERFDPPQRTLIRPWKNEKNHHKGIELRDVLGTMRLQVELTGAGNWPLEGNGVIENYVLGENGFAVVCWGDAGGHDWAAGGYYSLSGNRKFYFEVDRFTYTPTLALSDVHHLLAASSYSGKITLYDTRTSGRVVSKVAYGSGGGEFISISPAPERLIALHETRTSVKLIPLHGTPTILKLAVGTDTRQLDVDTNVEDAEFCGPLIACLLNDHRLRFFEMETLPPA
jgi:hypothetical protein